MHMKKLVAFLAVVCVLAPAHSGEPEKSAKAVAPFLDEQAFAVARVDLAGVDLDAVLHKLVGLAFPAAGESTFQAVVVPPATVRKAVMELIPNLPAQFGNVPVAVVDKGIVWLALGVNVAPKMSIRYVVQSRDEAAAKDLAKLAET